jgi:hypothetical protein
MLLMYIWLMLWAVIIVLVPLHCLTELQMSFFFLVFFGRLMCLLFGSTPSEEEVEEGIQIIKSSKYYPFYKIMAWVEPKIAVVAAFLVYAFIGGVVIAIAITLVENAS